MEAVAASLACDELLMRLISVVFAILGLEIFSYAYVYILIFAVALYRLQSHSSFLLISMIQAARAACNQSWKS